MVRSTLGATSYVLAALTASGGLIGYAKSGSIPSAVAGCTVGLIYGVGAHRIQNREPYGLELSILASLVLGGSSLPRAIRLRKPVPVMLSVLSTFGLAVFGSAFVKGE
ncbi:related to UPF0136 membrane protein YJR085C [Cephalotrichum gorgonifer]|uniref:Related to UPF0136 membrane protein YJR085C n=1 Tax=Cephalotrichum gorgonifer TaxID=2041049 RepID=A0AAE8MPI2_9PEZI|nr:related to UPF0136 membrane protein YJR085C [Cephalotrichum gorgonifer]